MQKGFVYEQRTGAFGIINAEFDCPIAEGYSGRGVGLNEPEAEDIPQVGPIPKGVYRLRVMAHIRFAAPAIHCEPDEETRETLREFGRSGFWIHGDNTRADRSASRGCIILDLHTRRAVASLIEMGFTHLRVVP